MVSLQPQPGGPSQQIQRSGSWGRLSQSRRAMFVLRFATLVLAAANTSSIAQAEISVADFLPEGHVRDGSVSYQSEIQQAVDAAAQAGETLRFPAISYLVDHRGWQLRSHLTLEMHGATFAVSETCDQDGAVFRGEGITDVTLRGGRIVGRNDVWKDGVNIRGVMIAGQSQRIRIRGAVFQNLSSNGIGLFGTPKQSIRDVWIEDVVVENCCKRYPDYLSGEKPEAGSVREDQGDVALYYVDGFVVRGCRFERSRSDGTHFYKSRNGQITDNRIFRAKMGGYFLEGCEDVVGRGNVILENGSRGTTIERGSKNCVFTGNVVRRSGREGLWAPDCVGLVVTGNVFDQNGRKPNGPQRRHIWNANITINEASRDPSSSPTQNYLISNNLIRSTAGQIAAIRVDAVAETDSIVIQNNSLVGENRKIVVEGPAHAEVIVVGNQGRQD